MKSSRISIMAALGRTTRAIGRKGQLPWKIPGDLPRFKKLTMGHPIIMGRKTYESIGKILPNRTNIIVSRNPRFAPLGGKAAKSLNEAISIAKDSPGSEEIFVIGGGEIYAQTLPVTDRLYLTLVDDEPEADTFFPDYGGFRIVFREKGTGTPPHEFLVLER